MNLNWHYLLGKYNISDKSVSLDYSKSISDPFEADLTVRHETTHSILSNQTEFGLATQIFTKINHSITNTSKADIEDMAVQLYQAQFFTQEGIATLMQFLMAVDKKGDLFAKKWMLDLLEKNPKYYSYLQKLCFVSNYPQKIQDYFTTKIPFLVMETGIRKQAQDFDIFKNCDSLKNYFIDENNVPDKRLEKILNVLNKDMSLVSKSPFEIAKACGVKYFKHTTKKEVANFMTYITSNTEKPRIYKASEIGGALDAKAVINDVYENMEVANININFSLTDFLVLDDFLFYSNDYEVVLAVQNPHDNNWDLYKDLAKTDPEIILYGFLKNGDKYLTLASKIMAEEVINNSLKNSTFAVKWGSYNPIDNKIIWSDTLKKPNLIIYRSPAYLKKTLEKVLASNPDTNFQHLHAGATENHPIQSLFVKIGEDPPIHIVNHYGNKGIIDNLNIIQSKSSVMKNEFLVENKKHLNNLLSFWMGLFWEVDWVESMIDVDTPHFRR